MIIRQAIIRQGRRFAVKPRRAIARSYAIQTDQAEIQAPSFYHEQPIPFDEEVLDLSEPQQSSSEPIPEVSLDRKLITEYKTLKHQKQTTHTYGSTLTPHYQPHTLLSNPPRPSEITIELLLASQTHMGHSTSLWNPANSRFIFGIRQGMHIISLEATAAHLRRACRVVSGVAERGGLILFVGTRAGQERPVVRAAQLAGGCHLFTRWTPGAITNGQQILNRCEVKAVDEMDREIVGVKEELAENAPALKPDLVVCLNPIENWVLLHECALHRIPTIGVVDTDADPTWVTYPIPANDDSLRCIHVIAGVLGRAGEEGQVRRKESAKDGKVGYVGVDLGRFNFKEEA